jgi:hypothetical protein
MKLLLDNSLADKMRRRGNERVSVRQAYGYGRTRSKHLQTQQKCAPLAPSCFGRAVLVSKYKVNYDKK